MMPKIGIVGAGSMAFYHYEGFVKAGAEVVCVADMDITRAETFASERRIGKVYRTSTEMLRDEPHLDAVSIVTPNKYHKSLTLEALEAGKHVFCEKPPALNAGEMEEMLIASKQSGKTLMFDFNNRARPESQAMIRYIREGVAGRINSTQAFWCRRTGIPGFDGWFTTKGLSGGGSIIDLPHMIDLALYFMGYPDAEWCLAGAFYDFMNNKVFKGPWGFPDFVNGATDVESSCHAMITFKTGQILMVRCSWAEFVEREVSYVTFQGTKAGGKVESIYDIDGHDHTRIDSCLLFTEEYGNQVNRNIIVKKDESMGRIEQACNFALVIAGKAKALNTAGEALQLMKIIDAMYASAQTKAPVKIQPA
jgi:predicted dehydrogenase